MQQPILQIRKNNQESNLKNEVFTGVYNKEVLT